MVHPRTWSAMVPAVRSLARASGRCLPLNTRLGWWTLLASGLYSLDEITCVVEVALVSHAPVRVDGLGGAKVDWQLAILRTGGAQAVCDWLSGLRQGEMVAS